MARRSMIAGLVAALALTAPSAAAQDDDYMFDRNRPDGFGPPGVTGHFTLDAGEILWNFSYTRDDWLGNRNGTTPLFQQDVLDLFTVAPISMLTQTLNLELRMGITDRFTLAVSAPFIFRDDLNETETAFFGGFTNDVGDVKVNTLWNVLDPGPHVLTFGIGVSVPTGEINEHGRTATSSRAQLPFNMQTGSGTWDLIPSLSFISQNEAGTFGAQVGATFHVHKNARGYRLGDRFDMTSWVSYKMNDWIAVNARVVYTEWSQVHGPDPDTNALEDPRADPSATGGVRTQLPFGVTLHIREGFLEGHRLSVEYLTPIHEDLNGPQLQADNSVRLAWQVAF